MECMEYVEAIPSVRNRDSQLYVMVVSVVFSVIYFILTKRHFRQHKCYELNSLNIFSHLLYSYTKTTLHRQQVCLLKTEYFILETI